MELKINEKKDNPLLSRMEIYGTIKFEGVTPSNSEVATTIAKEIGKDLNLVVMKHLYSKFSHQEAVFHALIYENQEAKAKAEVVTKHLKKKAEEVKKAETKAAEEKKVVEEKKKETPVEEKALEGNDDKKEEASSTEQKEEVKA